MINEALQIEALAFVAPFKSFEVTPRTRTLARHLRKAGIYLIKQDGIIVYVGMSKVCVVKACYRHFEKWTNSRGIDRMTYKDNLEVADYSIIILPIANSQVEGFERAMIATLQPRDNKNKLEQYWDPAFVNEMDDDLPF